MLEKTVLGLLENALELSGNVAWLAGGQADDLLFMANEALEAAGHVRTLAAGLAQLFDGMTPPNQGWRWSEMAAMLHDVAAGVGGRGG